MCCTNHQQQKIKSGKLNRSMDQGLNIKLVYGGINFRRICTALSLSSLDGCKICSTTVTHQQTSL